MGCYRLGVEEKGGRFETRLLLVGTLGGCVLLLVGRGRHWRMSARGAMTKGGKGREDDSLGGCDEEGRGGETLPTVAEEGKGCCWGLGSVERQRRKRRREI